MAKERAAHTARMDAAVERASAELGECVQRYEARIEDVRDQCDRARSVTKKELAAVESRCRREAKLARQQAEAEARSREQALLARLADAEAEKAAALEAMGGAHALQLHNIMQQSMAQSNAPDLMQCRRENSRLRRRVDELARLVSAMRGALRTGDKEL